jgi:hypothetical protein
MCYKNFNAYKGYFIYIYDNDSHRRWISPVICMFFIYYLFRTPPPPPPRLPPDTLFFYSVKTSVTCSAFCGRVSTVRFCFGNVFSFCFEVTHVDPSFCVDILFGLNVFTDLHNGLNPLWAAEQIACAHFVSFALCIVPRWRGLLYSSVSSAALGKMFGAKMDETQKEIGEDYIMRSVVICTLQ